MRRSGGRVFVARGEAVYELNDVAAFIWTLCDGTRTADEIAEQVRCTYEIDASSASRDTEALLSELDRLGLFEPAELSESFSAMMEGGETGG
jgi:pyrroloquinoline quinone biosynthesis protein D